MLSQEPGQHKKAALEHLIGHDLSRCTALANTDQVTVSLLFLLRERITVRKKGKPQGFIPDHRAQHSPGAFVVSGLHIFQGDRDHRELPHIPFTKLGLLSDLGPVKESAVITISKKSLQHAHI